MRPYALHFYTPDGASPTLDFAECVDDAAATRTGFSHLHQHTSCLGVDVYDGERLVIRLERALSEVRPIGTSILGFSYVSPGPTPRSG